MPLGKSYEVWNLKVTNHSGRARSLNVTGYAEFTNNNNYEQDQVNLQYSMFITRTSFEGNRIRQTIHGNLDGIEDGKEVDSKLAIDRFFGLAGAKVASWYGDRENFLGRYHGYGNPTGVINGNLGGEPGYNENGGGLPLVKFTYDPGHEDTPDDVSVLLCNDDPQKICRVQEG